MKRNEINENAKWNCFQNSIDVQQCSMCAAPNPSPKSISLPKQETIIPLIKICRKIKGCDEHQLTQWFTDLIKLFSKNQLLDLFTDT